MAEIRPFQSPDADGELQAPVLTAILTTPLLGALQGVTEAAGGVGHQAGRRARRMSLQHDYSHTDDTGAPLQLVRYLRPFIDSGRVLGLVCALQMSNSIAHLAMIALASSGEAKSPLAMLLKFVASDWCPRSTRTFECKGGGRPFV